MLRRARQAAALPLRLGFSRLAHLQISYQPDSQVDFGAHPEWLPLFERFIAGNRFNNAGDWPRFWSLLLNIKQVLSDGVDGDLAELGVWRGNTSAMLAHFAVQHSRRVHLFDTFEGFDTRDLRGVDACRPVAFSNTSIDLVQRVIGPNCSACTFHKGWFPASLNSEHDSLRFSVVSLDCDLYEPMLHGLHYFWPRLNSGGILLLHDYSSLHWPGAKQAIDEWADRYRVRPILLPDKSGSAIIRRHEPAPG